MTLTFPAISLAKICQNLFAPLPLPTPPETDVSMPHEDALAERAILREMMMQNPEAIQSDLGLMAMMTQYPQQF